MLIGKGTFSGRNSHALEGSFSLIQRDGSVLMETSDDFYFDGSPQPDWALFKGEPLDKDDPAVRAAALATRFGNMPGGIVEIRGRQTGIIQPGSRLAENDTIFLWCYEIPFILGVGAIERFEG